MHPILALIIMQNTHNGSEFTYAYLNSSSIDRIIGRTYLKITREDGVYALV